MVTLLGYGAFNLNKKNMKVAIIASKKNTKSLATEIAIKCNIPIVVKSFYCENEHNHYQVCEKQCKTCLMEEEINQQ